MRILITGVTETHINHPDRASSTKFVSIPELMANAYTMLGHQVEHRAVSYDESLAAYDSVMVYAYPLDHNALDTRGAVQALRSRPDAYLCLDDWSFQKIIPSWEQVIEVETLQNRTWLAPLFPWGDATKMQLPVDKIMAWDPSPLYVPPPVHQLAWRQRKTEWYNASLSSQAHEWVATQQLQWPVHSVGGKALGQPRLLESDIVWQYGSYKGVLCPTYSHAGSGWWRVRYLHAVAAGCVLGGSPLEMGMIGESYSFTPEALERMDNASLQAIMQAQAHDLQTASLRETLNRLESFL